MGVCPAVAETGERGSSRQATQGMFPTVRSNVPRHRTNSRSGKINRTATNRAMPPKIRDVLEMLHRDGWQQVRQVGSHRQLKHPGKPGRVTVAGKPGDDVPVGLLKSILRQAGLKR